MIMQGDGSWAKIINEGLCPRCIMSLHGENNQCNQCGWIWNPSHATSDARSEETDMHTTRLEASEQEICEESVTNPSMEWPEAMTLVEDAIRFKLDYMGDYPHDYTEADRQRLESAWNRVLRG